MSQQVSPFAALTGAEKQIRWLEYQSIRLPYVQSGVEEQIEEKASDKHAEAAEMKQTYTSKKALPLQQERPQPPPEIPRTVEEFQKTKHSQYDAVIARMKQAELQTRRFQNL